MKQIFKALFLICLITTSCNSRAEKSSREESSPKTPSIELPQEVIEIRQTDVIREALLAIIEDEEGAEPYYCLAKNEDEVLKLFSHICGEQPYVTRYIGDSVTHTYSLPKHKGTLQLTCYNENDGLTLAKLSVRIKEIPHIKTIKFMTSPPAPTSSREEYQRGNLSEIDY